MAGAFYYGLADEDDAGKPVVRELLEDLPDNQEAIAELRARARREAQKGQPRSVVRLEVLQTWIG